VVTLRRINGSGITVNAELIELVEGTPDTHLTLVTGRKIMVADTVDEVIAKVLAYRRAIQPPHPVPAPLAAARASG
jgi:flagellar protein FlbD